MNYADIIVDFVIEYHWFIFLLCFPIAFLMIPIGQAIEYRRDVRKHGKYTADEIRKRRR